MRHNEQLASDDEIVLSKGDTRRTRTQLANQNNTKRRGMHHTGACQISDL